jgi:hypothetical protein
MKWITTIIKKVSYNLCISFSNMSYIWIDDEDIILHYYSIDRRSISINKDNLSYFYYYNNESTVKIYIDYFIFNTSKNW